MRVAERYLRLYYFYDLNRQWNGAAHPPEWYDHRTDLFTWSSMRQPLWVERGVYSREVMRIGDRVLDLCSGDGFFAYHFYSGSAAQVDCVDRDDTAIAHARRFHALPNVSFSKLDIFADPFPGKDYDVICFDAAIEHFTLEQIDVILKKCAAALKPHGVLTGYTNAEADHGKAHPDHQHEFGDEDELRGVVSKVFAHVGTVKTVYKERTNLYFRASMSEERLKRF